jgi:hypothetical protein
MPQNKMSDEELLACVPYAPDKVRLEEIIHASITSRSSTTNRMQRLEQKGLVCSYKPNLMVHYYYRPTEQNNKKENEASTASSKGVFNVQSKYDS